MSGAKQIVDKNETAGEREEIPISVRATTNELSTDKLETRGSYTGVEPLAEDQHRIELGQKAKYPLRTGGSETTDRLSDEEKELRAQSWAGENDGSGERREMKTHLGSTGQWQDTKIPYSSLAPEKITGSHFTRRTSICDDLRLCTVNSDDEQSLLSHVNTMNRPITHTPSYKRARAHVPSHAHPYTCTHSHTHVQSETTTVDTDEDEEHTLSHTRTHTHTRITLLADEKGHLTWKRESRTHRQQKLVRVSEG